jgi:hypothetical protein
LIISQPKKKQKNLISGGAAAAGPLYRIAIPGQKKNKNKNNK